MAKRFSRGDQVEVCCNDEGFKGAYFEATVISEITPNEYIVQYTTLLREDELAPLREMVSPLDLRPVPPDVPVEDYNVKDVVDAYANEGWWMGRVTKKRHGRGNRRKYFVRFEGNQNEEIGKYKMSQLRVHQEWVCDGVDDGGGGGGCWVCCNSN